MRGEVVGVNEGSSPTPAARVGWASLTPGNRAAAVVDSMGRLNAGFPGMNVQAMLRQLARFPPGSMAPMVLWLAARSPSR